MTFSTIKKSILKEVVFMSLWLTTENGRFIQFGRIRLSFMFCFVHV